MSEIHLIKDLPRNMPEDKGSSIALKFDPNMMTIMYFPQKEILQKKIIPASKPLPIDLLLQHQPIANMTLILTFHFL